MPSEYIPTGRPRGRPSNASKPAVERLHIQDAVALLKDTTVDRANRPLDAICPDCFPSGWSVFDGGRTDISVSVNCQHGIWVRRP